MPLVVDGDEEPTGPAVDEAVALAGQSHRRCVDNGHHLLQVIAQHTVEQLLIAVLAFVFM